MKKPTTMMTIMRTVMAAAAAALLASSAAAADKSADKDPLAYPDGSRVALTGVVTESNPATFTMRYSEGTVLVEMDDWDWYPEAHATLPGDTVTVSGRVDKDGFAARRIEAGTVYVHGTNNYYFATPVDEEEYDPLTPGITAAPGVQPSISLEGTVVEKNLYGTFKMSTGFGTITVDTTRMAYNPLDDFGHQQIETGHKVLVVGHVDKEGDFGGLFDRRQVDAESIVTLSRDAGRSEVDSSM